ncbi:glycoside hydrolase domain-containing protein [Pedobacter antarcticus]|uniref:glycoside hydrolase domain-containing protein n=1 Tax=Pedobacter antarcticus TaxID=34086 RepID=UPI002931889A|nr:glycoside hydrolase domain-containing protein [Pedobacter antarcticus]
MNKYLYTLLFIPMALFAQGQSEMKGKEVNYSRNVNVFLGTSGDRGQLSPAASYPFSMMSIGPQTYPKLHAGYEYKAKIFEGFTHNRIEGVGCQGSGGNILIKPFLGEKPMQSQLIKTAETASPGNYKVSFTNQIKADLIVHENEGLETYIFPEGKKGFYIDLSHTLANQFQNEEHEINGQEISGYIQARTTCNVGSYKIYYTLKINTPVKWTTLADHKLQAELLPDAKEATIRIAFSSVDVSHARTNLSTMNAEAMLQSTISRWNDVLGSIDVKGDQDRTNLFYSLYYRGLQSPYLITEKDGSYRNTKGEIKQHSSQLYNGWAIWDNYRTQLPLLSITLPEIYQGITNSIENLYRNGKQDYATQTEPTNTVRTEHAMVVLLDAFRKGYGVDFASIRDSLIKDADKLDYSHPDKTLESSYDCWALAQILDILKEKTLSNVYLKKAEKYKEYWKKDFADISKKDVDRVSARGLYQGTILQYRWFAPFDLKGLINLMGGEQAYIQQLDDFFGKDQYNHANEPDIQVPLMYNATGQPWKSQVLIRKLGMDTVVQYYFNDNSRGIDPFIDRIYQNKPEAYIRTMDDDAGAMSSWYVLAACGISPACVGMPVYYLNVPFFEQVTFNWPGGKSLRIKVKDYADNKPYIQAVHLNGKKLNRLWITQDEIMQGGELEIISSAEVPGNRDFIPWISSAFTK